MFKLVYKFRAVMRDGLIEATSLERATELGRKWCEDNRAQFISVVDAFLIREPKPLVTSSAGSTTKK